MFNLRGFMADKIKIKFYDIENLTDEIKGFIRSNLSLICYGENKDLKKTIKEFLKRYESKSEKTQKGYVAEFIAHIFLNKNNFKQECLFFNISEGSIKKGFDGYYTKDGNRWILESKSGNLLNKNINQLHIDKVKKATDDIEDKIKGNASNNPWRNAYHHALIRKSGQSLTSFLNDMADNWDEGVYIKADKLRIIPTSTIFIEGNFTTCDINNIKTELENYYNSKSFNSIRVICITQKSRNLLIDYLKEIIDE